MGYETFGYTAALRHPGGKVAVAAIGRGDGMRVGGEVAVGVEELKIAAVGVATDRPVSECMTHEVRKKARSTMRGGRRQTLVFTTSISFACLHLFTDLQCSH